MHSIVAVYELAEASRYLCVTAPEKPARYEIVRRWVRSGLPSSQTLPISAKNLFLAFEDLVSLRMIVALRIAGFSLQHIRKVYTWLQETTGYSRPFALKDLWASDTDIFVEMEERLLSATRRGQYPMEFVREWLRHLRRPVDGALDLSFKKVNGKEVASAWMPHLHVVLNPLVQFGTPCVEGTRIPTRAVWSLFLGGDKPQAIATDYKLPVVKVESALEWEKKVAGVVR